MRVQPRVKRLLLFSGPRGHVRADLVDNDNTTEQNEERGYISPGHLIVSRKYSEMLVFLHEVVWN